MSSNQIVRVIDDPTSLGNLLVQDGILTQFQLSEVLYEFRRSRAGDLLEQFESMLGEYLIEKSIITEEKLQLVRIRQSAVRNGGVEHHHVMEAMKVAEKTQSKQDSCADELLAASSCLALKAGF